MSLPTKLELVSFKICPFVQRSVIALRQKGIAFTLTHLNPQDKPAWFNAISPLGKVPVLLVDGTPLFESVVILEYVDEVYPPSLHPADPLAKAQHRAWVEFCSELLGRQHRMLMTTDAASFNEARDALQQGLQRLDAVIAPTAPYFAGASFHLVDCVYAPLFMRLALLKQTYGLEMPFSARMQAWSDALLALDVVKTSVVEDFPTVFANFLKSNNSYLLSKAAA